jgi:hypothetical protein
VGDLQSVFGHESHSAVGQILSTGGDGDGGDGGDDVNRNAWSHLEMCAGSPTLDLGGHGYGGQDTQGGMK